jgi:hypothetical protein
MTDYGHDLLFGTFITPAAQPAMRAVDLLRWWRTVRASIW